MALVQLLYISSFNHFSVYTFNPWTVFHDKLINSTKLIMKSISCHIEINRLRLNIVLVVKVFGRFWETFCWTPENIKIFCSIFCDWWRGYSRNVSFPFTMEHEHLFKTPFLIPENICPFSYESYFLASLRKTRHVVRIVLWCSIFRNQGANLILKFFLFICLLQQFRNRKIIVLM